MIQYPILTEKAVNHIEKNNQLTFIVTDKTTKQQVKEEIERLYKVKVTRVNMLHTMKGKKKAYVKLSPESKATDLATKLKIM